MARSVLLIKVERDGELHQVGYGDSRYYKRVHRTTVVMDAADMRGFFSADAPREYRDEEIAGLRRAFEDSVPSQLERDFGVMSLFVAPVTPPNPLPLFEEGQELVGRLHPIYSSGWSYRRHQSSLETFSIGAEQAWPRTRAQISESGVIQAAEVLALRPRDERRFVPSVAFERELIQSAHKYSHLLNDLGAPLPFSLGVSLLRVRDYIMFVDPAKYWADLSDDHSCKQDDARAAILHVPSVDAFEDLQSVATLMRPAFDEIWRAFNFDRSLNYDDEGKWNPA
jgi:hypothetical protein